MDSKNGKSHFLVLHILYALTFLFVAPGKDVPI